MTKTGATKNRILRLLNSEKYTLSDISTQLNLAPSTVSQHLQELKQMGAIEEIDNPHIKKWKYYRVNPNFNSYAESGGIMRSRMTNKVALYATGIIVIAIVAYLLIFNAAPSSAQLTPVPIALTDPPHVPTGTNSLVMGYSSLAVHTSGTANSGWTTINTSGSIDLMSLLNVSQVIGIASISQNSVVNMVRFNIDSAIIRINGTDYDVIVPSNTVTAHLVGEDRINSSSKVLLDLSPTVTAVFTNNSTAFMMVPSLKAIVVGGGNETVKGNGLHLGDKLDLRTDERDGLSHSRANISITDASLIALSNGSISLHVSVKDNSNQSVVLDRIIILGNETPSITINDTCATPLNGSHADGKVCCMGGGGNGRMSPFWCRFIGNFSDGKFKIEPMGVIAPPPIPLKFGGHDTMLMHLNMSDLINRGSDSNSSSNDTQNMTGWGIITGKFKNWLEINITDRWNSKFNSTNRTSLIMPPCMGEDCKSARMRFIVEGNTTFGNGIVNGSVQINDTEIDRLVFPKPRGGFSAIHMPMIEDVRGINFEIISNGALISGFPLREMLLRNETLGYNVTSNTIASFNYTGGISVGNDNFRINLVSGARYKIAVIGEDGAYAVANVTAS